MAGLGVLLKYAPPLLSSLTALCSKPIYPSLFVSFQVGPSPARLAPPTTRYPVLASSQVQSFLLPASCPAGRFLRVNLHGRQQQQVEDMQWYLAVERVQAFGRQVGLGVLYFTKTFRFCIAFLLCKNAKTTQTKYRINVFRFRAAALACGWESLLGGLRPTGALGV